MHIPIKRKILLSLLLSLLVVIVIGYTSYYTTLIHSTSSEQTITSRQITNHLQSLLLFIVDAETSERGYTITGDTAFLNAYDYTINNIEAEKSALRFGIESASFSNRELSELDSVISRRVAELSSTISVRGNAGFESALLSIVKRSDGKILMDEVRERISQMMKRERESTDKYEDLADSATRRFNMIFTFCAIAASLILVLGSVIINRELNVSSANEKELLKSKAELIELNRQLKSSNSELESFSYSVSHDLRAPLRHIIGFGQKLLKQEETSHNVESLRLIDKMSRAAVKMSTLIDDLLHFSRVGNTELHKREIDMTSLFKNILEDTNAEGGAKNIAWNVAPLNSAYADMQQIQLVAENLVSNAAKYTSKKENAIIEIGCETKSDENIYFIKDNGAGFDKRYSSKLFGVFQRLHREAEFPGTGIGLAIVRRIILRHGGRVWAEGETDRGAIFYFSLPSKNNLLII